MRFHLEQICSALIAVTLLSAPVIALAGPGGTGGGDPQELLEKGLGRDSKALKHFRKASSKDQKDKESGDLSAQRISQALNGWFELTSDAYRILYSSREAMKQSPAGPVSPTRLENTFKSVSLSFTGEFGMPGADGKSRRSLFASNPNTKTITINVPYWNEIFSISQLKFDIIAHHTQRDAKTTVQYIFDEQTVNLGLIGILIHESLVLNGFESSRSYPISSEIIRSIQKTFAFGIQNLSPDYSNETRAAIARLSQKLRHFDTSTIYENEFANVSAMIGDLTGIKVADLENGQVFIVDEQIARKLKSFETCHVKRAKLAVTIQKSIQLNADIYKDEMALATITDPVKYDEISMDLAEKRGASALLSAQMAVPNVDDETCN